MMTARRFFGRMWWMVIAGGALMLAGLIVEWSAPVEGGQNWVSLALLVGGTAVALAGYVLIIMYERREMNRARRGEPIDRDRL